MRTARICVYRRGTTVSSSRRWTTEPSNNAGLLDGCATGRDEEGKPPEAAVPILHAPIPIPFTRRGWCLPHPRAQLVTRAWPLSSSMPTDSFPISPSFTLRSATPRRPKRQRRLRYFMRWQWPSRIADWSAF